MLILMGSVPNAVRAESLSIMDAIRLERIQSSTAMDDATVAISPNGRKAAVVTWHGDLLRNTNVYTLHICDIAAPLSVGTACRAVLACDYPGDSHDQQATPFARLTFLGDNRTLAFLGRIGNASAQVFTVDIVSGEAKQLTHHPTAVRSFIVGPQGELQAFSAVVDSNANHRQCTLEDDGVFLWDRTLFPNPGVLSAAPLLRDIDTDQFRQYFLVNGSNPKLFFNSRQSRLAMPIDLNDPAVTISPRLTLADEGALAGWATLTGDPSGRHALLFPYGLTEHPMQPERYSYYKSANAYARRIAAPYGVVDLATGKIERLLDAPHPQFGGESGDPLWTSDGKAVIVYTLLPESPVEPAQWVEVDIATRKVTPLQGPTGWKPVSWMDQGRALVMARDGHFGKLQRQAGGGWGEFTELGQAEGFNSAWPVATNGKVVIGVKDSLTSPPELAMYDLETRKTTVLTNLNPQLRQRTYGKVEKIHWKTPNEPDAAGFLIKPVGYQEGKRYPLVILLDDNTMRRTAEPFLLDAFLQLSGHAIQPLAGEGFMVLYPYSPKLADVIQTPQEGVRYREHIEAAIAHLDQAGLIDPKRIGLSGWSRAAYHTEYLLIHSSVPFAAASAIDGGAFEYTDRMRPFSDVELQSIRTPLLFEPHGLPTLVAHAAMADRMKAMGKATEVLYFATASHSTTTPQHRLRSLGTHIDWWKFWLKGEEDPDPKKAAQYAQWRKLRELQAKVH